MTVRRGVTRAVLLVGRWAIKFPRRNYFVRGWLANRSEWRQRWRADVARPRLTIGHFAVVLPRADHIATESDVWPLRTEYFDQRHDDEVPGDECKPCSWGIFGGSWRLVDFDRAWLPGDRGLIGAIYYGRQERLARKWMALS